MRVVFLGTPADAVRPLRALHQAGHEVALVVTQPDRRRGRGPVPGPSPVKVAATELGLAVRTPVRTREVLGEIAESGATLGVVVAFGQLLPAALLSALPHGFVNLHFSLLPRWRGAAPVERALLAGDAQTGVCLMRVDEGLDTGPVFACRSTPIGPRDTAGELRSRLVALGTELLVETLPDVTVETPSPQVGEATYAEKLTVAEFAIDWSRPVGELDRLVRAGAPRPGAWTLATGARLKVWKALGHPGPAPPGSSPGDVLAVGSSVVGGDGVLEVGEVQPSGGPRMDFAAFLRGHGELARLGR